MSYQVLARKWRPRNFESLVGQEHVVRALSHALEQKRLHHAYLFTGTRGVGKTTLARILAKALNCEQGTSATPCGVCGACTEIDSGRFVDLLEVDAATNTRVDEMRLLLENAVYAPTRGRYKVYVIDEVHMLSNSAFNAMLKTLEEPPEHVKFILATTDPQKIPVTVLSRCLQFNLKQMPHDAVVDHLAKILDQEAISYDLPALNLVARAGAGSMRDSLSLLDQAIAHGAGKVVHEDVREMLGTVDLDCVLSVLELVLEGDIGGASAAVEAMNARSLSFDLALQEMAGMLVQVQLIQFGGGASFESDPARGRLATLAKSLPPERVQLAYQILVLGRQDLRYAPDPLAGFLMTLMRLHAFRLCDDGEGRAGANDTQAATRPVVTSRAGAKEVRQPAVATLAPVADAVRVAEKSEPAPAASGALDESGGNWRQIVQALRLGGMVRELAQHCELRAVEGAVVNLRLSPTHRHLSSKSSQDKLQQVLSDYLAKPVRLNIELGSPSGDTPAALEQRDRQVRLDGAVAAIEGDGFVREVIDVFDATLVDSSIKPVS